MPISGLLHNNDDDDCFKKYFLHLEQEFRDRKVHVFAMDFKKSNVILIVGS